MNPEQRYSVKFCVLMGKSRSQTLSMIQSTYGAAAMSRTRIYEWYNTFKDDPTRQPTDLPRTGRPSVLSGNALEIEALLRSDRRLTVRDIALKTGLVSSSIHRIIRQELGMVKVCARWVPRLLSSQQKLQRVADSTAFLKQYRECGERFLDSIITADETWVSLYDPETKQDSSVWKTPSSPSPTKAMVKPSAKKMMFIVFFDTRGVVLCHAVPTGRTVTAQYYSKVLRRDLARAVQKKRPEKDGKFYLHHDNATPHTSSFTKSVLAEKKIRTVGHPPYSPDLAPCDFWLFPTIKRDLRGRRFDDVDDLPVVVRESIRKIPAGDFKNCFKSWVERHHKCIQHGGEYFEKI